MDTPYDYWRGQADAGVIPNLDICTHTNSARSIPPGASIDWIRDVVPHGGAYDELVVTEFVDHSGEFNCIKRPEWYRPGFRRDAIRCRGKRSDVMDPETRQRSAGRAKRKARHAAIQLRVSHMITFTFADNVTDFDLASSAMALFNRKYRSLLPYEHTLRNGRRFKVSEWSYVMAPEPQERGSIHWHTLTNQTHSEAVVRKVWEEVQRELGMQQIGRQVNMKYLGGPRDRYRAIRYICKYIGKAFDDGDANRKRFYRSKGIPAPRRVVQYTLDDLSVDDVRAYIENEMGGRVVWCDVRRVGPFVTISGAWAPV